MEEILKPILEEDEKLLWSGRPESFETLDKTHKSNFIKRCVITAAVTAVLLALYFIAIGRTGAEVKAGLVVIVLLMAAYSVVSPLLHASQLRKKVQYAVTDKRLVIIKDEPKAMPYSQIGIAAIKTDADGHSSLLCGPSAVKSADIRWRGDTAAGIRTDTDSGLCDALVMYAVPEPEKLRAVLRPYLTLN